MSLVAAFLVGVYVLALVLGSRRAARARTARRAQVWTVTPLPVIDTVPFDSPAARPLELRRAGTGLTGTEPACPSPRCAACPLYGCASCALPAEPAADPRPLCPSCRQPAAVMNLRCLAHRYPPGAASRAYRESLTRRVRGDLRCLACVEPVIVDSDGVWLNHAPQCPRADTPLEVAIGQRPPYPAHRS